MRATVAFALVSTLSAAALADDAEPREIAVALTASSAIGWVDMGQFSSASETYFGALEGQVEGFSREGSAVSHLALAASLRSQLRLPRRITIETGIDLLRHRRTTSIDIGGTQGTIGYANTSLLLPLCFGIHAPLGPRLAVFGSTGPVLVVTSSSRWAYSLGQVSSFRGKVGGGFEAALGLEFGIVWRLRATALARYRFAKSGSLEPDGPTLPPLQPVSELGWKSVAAEIGARIVF